MPFCAPLLLCARVLHFYFGEKRRPMKMFFIGARFLVFLLVFLSAGHAFAQSVVVDCTGATPGAFNSLETAILNSPDNSSFSVSGTCAEGLSIQNRSNLVIF